MNRRTSHLVRSVGGATALGEEGGSLVEMAFACLMLIPILFGIIQLSIGLYCFHFAADAAREATRWAIVRGATCNGIFGKGYCSPTDANGTGATPNDIAQFVQGLGFPYSGAVTTTTKWCVNGGGTWTSCSSTQSDNIVGNQVQVTVTYTYPLVIPYVPKHNINLTSVSSMTIVQ